MNVRKLLSARGAGSTSSLGRPRVFSTRWRLFATSTTLAAIAACSLVVDSGRDQCATDTQCVTPLGPNAICVKGICQVRAAIADTGVEETAPPDPIWGCVGVPAPANAEVHVFARYQTLDGGAIPGVAVAACSGIGGCAVAPDGGRNVLGVTASDGLIEWTTKSTQPGGFKGVLETAATASVDDASAPFLPSLVSVSGAGETNAHSLEKAGPGKPRFPANLITQDQLESFAAAFRDDRVKIKPEYGTLLVTAYDCMQNLVSNAEIKSDNANVDTRTIYFDENGVLDPNLKVTSAFGRAVLVNVPPVSSLTVNLVVGGNKKATQVILGQAGTVTVVFLGPPR